tara:strand:+ start:3467 stop:3727 length:261 start_codon:yes stop_codon:yes gene_type:complete
MRKIIKYTRYEIVSEFYDNGDSSSVAKTIVEEGETAVNTYRLCVGSRNPLTQMPFNKDAVALAEYLKSSDENLWNAYWEDPVEEAE